MSKQNDDDIIWNLLLLITLFPMALVVSTIFRGYVFLVAWGWFIAPLGAPGITLVHAIGISVTASFITYSSSATDEDDKRDTKSFRNRMANKFFNGNLLTALVWGVLAIVHAFM